MATNVTVISLGPTSRRISWSIGDGSAVEYWLVYYSPESGASTNSEVALNVSSTNRSVDIVALLENEEYIFEVAAVFEQGGSFFQSQRVMATVTTSCELIFRAIRP